jgi:thiol-disulfide isomerase/thioredoxin
MTTRALLAAAFLVFGISVGARTASAQAVPFGDQPTIANTVFAAENGQPLRIGDLRGKVVVIDFWGVWCGPCMSEMPSLKEMQESLREYAGRIAYIFVSIKPDHFEADTAGLKQSGLTGSNLRWTNRTAEQFHAFFNTTGSRWWVPNSIVLDANGNVAKWVRGNGTDWRIHADLLRNLVLASASQR